MNERKADFILKGEEILYPAIVKDGLELYYDMRGKTNQDARKNVILDMSGKGRNATLTGFDYKGNSGHAEGLVFDERDDKLNRPAISGLDPNNLTFQINGNIVRFKADGTSQMVQDGQVVEIGRNLLTDTGVERSGIGYGFCTYIPASPLVAGETYTITTCITPAAGVTAVAGYLSSGYIDFARFSTTGAEKQIFSKTFTAKYSVGRTPADHISNANVVFYRFPNDGTVTNQSVVHWTKIERGSVATPWVPSPEDLIANLAYPNNVFGDLEDVIDDMDINRVTDTSVTLSDLKDNHVEVTVSGNTVQQSDWYAKEGLSSQVQTVQGKNLFDMTKFDTQVEYDGIDTYRYKLINWAKSEKSYQVLSRLKTGGVEQTGLYITLSFGHPNPNNAYSAGGTYRHIISNGGGSKYDYNSSSGRFTSLYNILPTNL